ncbi:hypothetical protein [Candidatus Frankia alpina]|uniref:hypothetical protein n=1 Tax=Candidatus Frankia alpina TaxID=2699483 RepID=UPI0013D8A034|nr:hypothetical protein [Candidatus Frankia alpina]
MTTHDADVNGPVPPAAPRRDDDFFAVERVGEPEPRPSAAPQSAGAMPPAGLPRRADPFDVTSTWDGPAPRPGGGSLAIFVAPPVDAVPPNGSRSMANLPSMSPLAPAAPVGTAAAGAPGRPDAGVDRFGAPAVGGRTGPGGQQAWGGPSADSVRVDDSPRLAAPAADRAPGGYTDPFTGGFPISARPVPATGSRTGPIPLSSHPQAPQPVLAPQQTAYPPVAPSGSSVSPGFSSPAAAAPPAPPGTTGRPTDAAFAPTRAPKPRPGLEPRVGPDGFGVTGAGPRPAWPAAPGGRGTGWTSPDGYGPPGGANPPAATPAGSAGGREAPRQTDSWNGHSSPRLRLPVSPTADPAQGAGRGTNGQAAEYPSVPPRGFGGVEAYPALRQSAPGAAGAGRSGNPGTRGPASGGRLLAGAAPAPAGGGIHDRSGPGPVHGAGVGPQVPPVPLGPAGENAREPAGGRGRSAATVTPTARPERSWEAQDGAAGGSGWRNPLTDTGSFVRPLPPPGIPGALAGRDDPLSGPLPTGGRRRETGAGEAGTGWRAPAALQARERPVPPVRMGDPTGADRSGAPAAPDVAPVGMRAGGPPTRRVEETMTTVRPDAPAPAGPPAGGPGQPGEAGGRGVGAAGPTGRRPETPSEMTSLVTRRASGRGRGTAAGPAGDDDSGWQPSRSVRKPNGRSVPADRRRTPNPVTDTNSLQPVSAPSGGRATADGRAAENGRADTGERRRRTADRAARGSATGPGARRAAGRRGEADGGRSGGGHVGPQGRSARGATSSGLLEPTDRRGAVPHDEPPPEDMLAWLRQGWIGPLAVALVVALLAVGGYVLLRGGGGAGGGTVASSPTADASSTPATTNPDALTGKAMIDGSWKCSLVTSANPIKLSKEVVGVLVVERAPGAYTWDGTAGQYTITMVAGNDGGNVIGDVKFTSGPLKDLAAVHIAMPGGGIRGKAQGTLELKASGTAPHRFCGVN